MIDFGLAKKLDKNFAETVCGTTEYMAPEVLKQEGHTKNVDWWAVGILIYEMTFGRSPFYDKNRMSLEENIIKKDVRWPDRNKYKILYSEELQDLVNKLLIKDPM